MWYYQSKSVLWNKNHPFYLTFTGTFYKSKNSSSLSPENKKHKIRQEHEKDTQVFQKENLRVNRAQYKLTSLTQPIRST